MPLFGEIKRTYSKKQKQVPDSVNNDPGEENSKENNRQLFNSSLDESYWKDSFDKFLEDKR